MHHCEQSYRCFPFKQLHVKDNAWDDAGHTVLTQPLLPAAALGHPAALQQLDMDWADAIHCPAGLSRQSPMRTSSNVSRMDFGFPGRLMMSAFPRMPAVWRDSTAVGTYLRLMERICSPYLLAVSIMAKHSEEHMPAQSAASTIPTAAQCRCRVWSMMLLPTHRHLQGSS
jgi:hypothetical protein